MLGSPEPSAKSGSQTPMVIISLPPTKVEKPSASPQKDSLGLMPGSKRSSVPSGSGSSSSPVQEDQEPMVTLPRRWLGADTLRRICKDIGVSPSGTKQDCLERIIAKAAGQDAKANTPHEALKSKKRLHGDLERLSSTSDGVDGRQAPKKRRCSPHDSATGSESFSSESNVVPAPAAPAPTLSTTTKSTVYITAQDIDRLFRTNDPSLLEDSAEPAPGEIITFFLADQIALCHALRARLFSSTSTRKASTVYRQALEAVQCWSVLHSPSDFQERPGSSSLRVSILQARSHFIDVPCLSRAGTVNAGPRVRHPNSTGPSPPKGDAISHAIDGRGPWWYSASVASHAAIKATGGRTSRSSNIRIGLLEVDQKGWNLQDGRPEGVEEIDWYLDGIKEVAPEKVDSIDAVMEDLFAR